MTSTLRLSITTPTQILFEDDVCMVIAPGADGHIGILAKHAPLVSQLKSGTIQIFKTNREKQDVAIPIRSGFLHVVDNRCEIYCVA